MSDKWRQYRELTPGEFIIAFADAAQGGNDYNAVQFLSYDKLDVPLVYHTRGVAATVTSDLVPVLGKIFDQTGVRPLVAYERNNGGGSEMERLKVLNRDGKYTLFYMPKMGVDAIDMETRKLGWDTNHNTREKMLGDLKYAIDNNTILLYDKETVDELWAFVVGRTSKVEARKGAHDDLLMSLAGAWQLYQLTPYKPDTVANIKRKREMSKRVEYFDEKGFY